MNVNGYDSFTLFLGKGGIKDILNSPPSRLLHIMHFRKTLLTSACPCGIQYVWRTMERVCETPKCSDIIWQLSISKSVTLFFFGSRIGALASSVRCAAPGRLTHLIILSLSKVSPNCLLSYVSFSLLKHCLHPCNSGFE